MSTRVIPGIIVSVVAGMIIFFTITFPRHYTDQLHDIDKGLAKLEGRLEGLGELRKYDAAPERIVAKPHAEELHGAFQAPKGAVNGYSFVAPKADDIVCRHFIVKLRTTKSLKNKLRKDDVGKQIYFSGITNFAGSRITCFIVSRLYVYVM